MEEGGMEDFGQQIQQEIPRLRRYAMALTGDRHRAEDLVQDCLERALNKSHLWRRGSSLRAWLFTILHNLFANQARRFRTSPSFMSLDEMVRAPGKPGAQVDHVQLGELWAAIQTLPEEQREVVLLVGMEQMKYGEVAKVLDIPIGTVMSRLYRGRERLRALFPEHPKAHLRRVK